MISTAYIVERTPLRRFKTLHFSFFSISVGYIILPFPRNNTSHKTEFEHKNNFNQVCAMRIQRQFQRIQRSLQTPKCVY